ncbi:MAG TPA: hypothetical protein VJ828_12160 [Lacipirellulaceae bacterium]|nr:hypothetical protein [Lacipirellulaceae bacterium]
MFRRWKLLPRYRLRTLLVVITALCVLLTALPFEARQYQQRKARIRSLIAGLGGSVDTCGWADEPSPGSNWISSLLGYVEPREAQWHVNLTGTSVDAEAIRKLRGCNWILRLDLSSSNIGDDALDHVATLEDLLELRLRGTRVTDAGLLKLKPLRQLMILDVAGTAATYRALAQLEQEMRVRANLQEQLAIARVREAGIIVDLGTVALRAQLPPDVSVSPEVAIASMQAELTNFGLQPEAAGAIHINQPLALTKKQIDDLRRLVSAKSLFASGTRFPSGGLSFLPELKNLETLTIDEARTGNLSDDDMRWIAQTPSLKTLELSSSNLTDAGIAHIAAAPHLRALSIGGSGFADNLFAPFRSAHQLEALTVHANNLTPELVANLRGLKRLRRLELNLWYRGGGGEPEAAWPDPMATAVMQWVYGRPPADVNRATRKSLAYLTELPNLKLLTLCGNLMVADTLSPITKLTGLEWLKVDGRYVSHDEARRIQVAMPHCHVQRLDLE